MNSILKPSYTIMKSTYKTRKIWRFPKKMQKNVLFFQSHSTVFYFKLEYFARYAAALSFVYEKVALVIDSLWIMGIDQFYFYFKTRYNTRERGRLVWHEVFYCVSNVINFDFDQASPYFQKAWSKKRIVNRNQTLVSHSRTVQKLKRGNLIWACFIYMRHIIQLYTM